MSETVYVTILIVLLDLLDIIFFIICRVMFGT